MAKGGKGSLTAVVVHLSVPEVNRISSCDRYVCFGLYQVRDCVIVVKVVIADNYSEVL